MAVSVFGGMQRITQISPLHGSTARHTHSKNPAERTHPTRIPSAHSFPPRRLTAQLMPFMWKVMSLPSYRVMSMLKPFLKRAMSKMLGTSLAMNSTSVMLLLVCLKGGDRAVGADTELDLSRCEEPQCWHLAGPGHVAFLKYISSLT